MPSTKLTALLKQQQQRKPLLLLGRYTKIDHSMLVENGNGTISFVLPAEGPEEKNDRAPTCFRYTRRAKETKQWVRCAARFDVRR